LYNFSSPYAEYSLIGKTHKVSTPVPLDDETWRSITKKYQNNGRGPASKNYKIDYTIFGRIIFLHVSNEKIFNIIWYRPAEEAHISVYSKIYKISMPAVVFHVKASKLNIYLAKEMLVEHTVLYDNPFGNLIGDHICMGNVKTPETTNVSEFIKGWESAFYDSKFTDLVNSNYSRIKNFRKSLETDGIVMMNKLIKSKRTIQSLKNER
jgi:hypothetical protein